MLAPSYSEQTEQQHNFTEIVSGWDACAYLGNSKLDALSGPHELSWEVEASDKYFFGPVHQYQRERAKPVHLRERWVWERIFQSQES